MLNCKDGENGGKFNSENSTVTIISGDKKIQTEVGIIKPIQNDKKQPDEPTKNNISSNQINLILIITLVILGIIMILLVTVFTNFLTPVIKTIIVSVIVIVIASIITSVIFIYRKSNTFTPKQSRIGSCYKK